MTPQLWFNVFMAASTLAVGVLAYLNGRRANRTSEKKLTIEEQAAEDVQEDLVARRRGEELARVYERIDKLEKVVDELKESDRLKQITIEGLTDLLARVRSLFLTFIQRVELAWEGGHSMPQLTELELALLKDVYPYQRSALLK